jgi:hypothetical protein
MRKKKRSDPTVKDLRDLLWSDRHWLFATDTDQAREALFALAKTPEVQQWGGEVEALLILHLTPDIPFIWVGGISKALLPPQVMARVLERVGIAPTARWLAGIAPILFLCVEVPRAQVLMEVLANLIGGTRFDWTGEIACAE